MHKRRIQTGRTAIGEDAAERSIDRVVRVVRARLVKAQNEKPLRVEPNRHAAFKFLRRFHGAHGFRFRRRGNAAEIRFGQTFHLLRVHVANDTDDHVAGLIVSLEEIHRVFPGKVLQVAHVADGRLAVWVRLVGDGKKFFHGFPDGVAIGPHPALLHHHIALLVEFAEHGIAEPFGFKEEPKLGGVRRQAEEVVCLVAGGGCIQSASARLFDRRTKLVADHKLPGGVLRGFELAFQLLYRLRAGASAFVALPLQGFERGVHPIQGVLLFGVILGADGGGALEGHVFEHVGEPGKPRLFLGRSGVHIRIEGSHRGLMALQHDELHSVREREFGDAGLHLLERFLRRGGERDCERKGKTSDWRREWHHNVQLWLKFQYTGRRRREGWQVQSSLKIHRFCR